MSTYPSGPALLYAVLDYDKRGDLRFGVVLVISCKSPALKDGHSRQPTSNEYILSIGTRNSRHVNSHMLIITVTVVIFIVVHNAKHGLL